MVFLLFLETVGKKIQTRAGSFTRLIRRMLDLKDCKVGLSLILLSNLDHIQLFRERLSEQVHTTISNRIVGGFEFTNFQKKKFEKMT